MNVNDLIELVRAGYSKEEIQALTQAGENERPEAEVSEPAPEQLKLDLEEAPKEKEEKPAWAVSLEKVMADMVKTMQSYNRAMSGRGTVETVQTTEDILREMFSEPK